MRRWWPRAPERREEHAGCQVGPISQPVLRVVARRPSRHAPGTSHGLGARRGRLPQQASRQQDGDPTHGRHRRLSGPGRGGGHAVRGHHVAGLAHRAHPLPPHAGRLPHARPELRRHLRHRCHRRRGPAQADSQAAGPDPGGLGRGRGRSRGRQHRQPLRGRRVHPGLACLPGHRHLPGELCEHHQPDRRPRASPASRA